MFDIVKKCVDFVYQASTQSALYDPLETIEAGLSYVFPKQKRVRSPSVATSPVRSRSPGEATPLTAGMGPEREERSQNPQKTSLEDTQTQSQGAGVEGVEQTVLQSPASKAKTNAEVPDPRVDAEDSKKQKKQKKTSLKESQAQAQGDGTEGVEQTTSQSRKRKATDTPKAPDDAEGSKKRKKTSSKATQIESQGDDAEGSNQSRKRKAKTTPETSDRKRKARKTCDDAGGSKTRTGPDHEPPVSKKSKRKVHRHRPPEVSDFQVAYKWFHLVRRRVMKDNTSDYILECAFMPFAIVAMIYHGWIDLIDVLGWKDARHLLGEGLLKLSAEHDMWQKLEILADVTKPSEWEKEDFQRDWTISTNPENAYDWFEDGSDWTQHGPFGPALARYATPDVLEEVLEMQFRDGVQLDKVDLPGNWKRLFLPLFLRKQKNREVMNEQTHQEGAKEVPEPEAIPETVPEDDGGKRRARQTTVEDAPDDDDVRPRVDEWDEGRPILEGPFVEVRDNKVDPVSPPPTMVEPADQSAEMRADEVQATFAVQPDVVNGVLYDNVWTNVKVNFPPFQTYSAASFPTDVRMDEEAIQQQPLDQNGGVDVSQADSDMSFDFTGPPQIMEPQLGVTTEVSSVGGAGGDALAYGTYMSAEKRVKYTIDTSQASQPHIPQSHPFPAQFSQSHTAQLHPSQVRTPLSQTPQVQATLAQSPQAQAPLSQAPQAQAPLAPPNHTIETRPTQTYTTAQPNTSSISPSGPNPNRRGARQADHGRPRQRPRDRHRRAAATNTTSNGLPYDPLVAALAGIPKPKFG